MRRLLLPLLCCCLFGTVYAQTPPQLLTVKGIVIDSTVNKPLSYVTVVLLDVASQQSVKGGLTKDDGSFELKAPVGKTYQLTVASVGYKSKVVKLTGSGNEFNVGKILLSVSSNQLNEVSVTAVKPIMKQEVDRISYDVQADPESKAMDALDIFRKVPLLSVDGNDNIKLKGSGNYKILINGNESAMVAKNPSDVLKAMPATNIEKIEVITTPPAKYDAEGLSGIINIITKKNADEGYNGGINARYNSVFGPGIYGHASVKEGKFGVNFFLGTNRDNGFNAASGNTQQIFGGQNTTQTGIGHNQFHNYFGNAELSYEIDSLNLLTASFETYNGKENNTNNRFSNTLNQDGSIAQQYRQMSSGYNAFQGLDASVNYQIGFKRKKDQLLTLSYKFSYSPNTNSSNNIFSERVNDDASLQPDFNQYNNAGEREHTIQVDYAEPFKKLTLEAGGKVILRNDFSDFNQADLDPETNQYIVNPLYTDNFTYQQNVYSLYNSYQLKMDKFTAKAG